MMAQMPNISTVNAGGGTLHWNSAVGHIDRLILKDGTREIVPLHRAPWCDDETADVQQLPPVERHLTGDFLCAPFGPNELDDHLPHGNCANTAWDLQDVSDRTLTAVTDGPLGSRIGVCMTLASDAPLLYQVHSITGGAGDVPVAHHPMVHMQKSGRLSMSPKRAVITPKMPLEAGRHALTYPAQSTDATAFPGTSGAVDLTVLPIGTATEDFVTMVEDEASTLGWTAVVREVEDDVVFFLKDPRVLPVTMFWHSNGGRDYAPWNGTHSGVIGIEDGVAAGPDPRPSAPHDTRIAEEDVPTALTLARGRTHRIVHVTGALARPEGWTRVTDIRIEGSTLVVEGSDSTTRVLPFETHIWKEQ